MSKLSTILKALIREAHKTETAVSRETGIGQPVIHRLASGETTNPKVATLAPIAQYFNITIGQLIGEEPLPKDRIPGTYYPGTLGWSHVPLLNWNQIEGWINAEEADSKRYPLISTDITISDKGYALRVKDTTMRPRFPENTLVIIDPKHKPDDRDFAIIQVKGQNQPLFKQILIDGDIVYLKPLNTEFKTLELSKDYNFLGTMVQARMDFEKEPQN